ncbi:MAG: hypothetical protein ACXV5R_08765, partial [Candidatus Angelobacter sp.]
MNHQSFMLVAVFGGDVKVSACRVMIRSFLLHHAVVGRRTRDRLMHDLLTFTRNEAILRHAGEATGVINNYRSLSTTQKNQLITFLQS